MSGLPDLRVGLWQDETPAGGLRDVLDEVGRALAEARAAGVALLVFPECYLTGYYRPAAEVPAIAGAVGPAQLAQLSRLVETSGVAMVIGSYQQTGQGVANAAHVFLPGAPAPQSYHKRALFGDWEKAVFTPGTAPLIFEHAGRRFAVLICFDVEFPELVREAAVAGADTVLVPTALMAPEDDAADFLVPARAIENGISVVYANRIGTEQELTFIGKSQICGPHSRTRRIAPPGFRGLLHAPLSTGPAPIDYVTEATTQRIRSREGTSPPDQ